MDKQLKFVKKDVKNMTFREFAEYYNNEWFPFLKKVSDYGTSLDTLRKMLFPKEKS